MGKEKLAIIGSGNWYVHVAAFPTGEIVDPPCWRDCVEIIRSREFGSIRSRRAGSEEDRSCFSDDQKLKA
jgi:hypothetical protein